MPQPSHRSGTSSKNLSPAILLRPRANRKLIALPAAVERNLRRKLRRKPLAERNRDTAHSCQNRFFRNRRVRIDVILVVRLRRPHRVNQRRPSRGASLLPLDRRLLVQEVKIVGPISADGCRLTPLILHRCEISPARLGKIQRPNAGVLAGWTPDSKLNERRQLQLPYRRAPARNRTSRRD